MVIKPMVRSNICINSHPLGCEKAVENQIAYVKKQFGGKKPDNAPRLVLVIGCSTGYGLASRIVSAFGCGAATVGVSFEKPATTSKPGTPGWYNNQCFDAEAAAAGLCSKTLNADAFSNETKAAVVEAVKETAKAAGLPSPQIDLVIYSLASPVRTDPSNGVTYKSVIKPVGKTYSGKTFDIITGKITEISVEPATEEETASTIKVMGGEDWELWIDALKNAGVLAPAFRTIAYTYIGPKLSWDIYKNGTIGRAKEDLERAARDINKKTGGENAKHAWVSVNKALVTRSSAVIPIIPLYISCLFKVMKEKGLHEGCIEQMVRLFRERLYTAEAAGNPQKIPVDAEGRIRIDDLEMRDDVQKEASTILDKVTEENIMTETDAAGFKHDFLEANGFDVAGVDYEADVKPDAV
ncbi:MAG: trans-2-enoyl-CoA reductase family protein [Spirochaetaceae bacterium]|jgi:enoyl-[acyl-carrier protein] reductase/trans-2-enoyl-CoA reductase (NAD+)|nr:trans-2-enoyl-CoA reductase family protein [Spirochaetaceae bacterium]